VTGYSGERRSGTNTVEPAAYRHGDAWVWVSALGCDYVLRDLGRAGWLCTYTNRPGSGYRSGSLSGGTPEIATWKLSGDARRAFQLALGDQVFTQGVGK
jgi:hypothetical protein